MAREKGGDWDGSTVIEDYINFLRDMRRMPNAAFVKARVPPTEEISPAPKGTSGSSSARTSSAASAFW